MIKKAGSISVVVLFAVTAVVTLYLVVAPPRNSYVQYFVIEQGESAREIAYNLKSKGLIQSEFLYRVFSKVLRLDDESKSGTYAIERPETLLTWLFRINRADYRVTPVKVTLVEGLNVFETGKALAKALPHISEEEFVRLAKDYEGYLYPDTYLVLPDVTESDMLDLLLETFTEKTKDIFLERDLTEQQVADVVNLASIVEEETFNNTDRRIVAGVLQNRLNINMPLQVDVTFQYVNGKNSYTLTAADLKEDSPYNTYVNKGLPPTPISSPSLESIMAVLDPEPNDYLYFLSSKSGVMYYAKTFEGHIRNRQLYL